MHEQSGFHDLVAVDAHKRRYFVYIYIFPLKTFISLNNSQINAILRVCDAIAGRWINDVGLTWLVSAHWTAPLLLGGVVAVSVRRVPPSVIGSDGVGRRALREVLPRRLTGTTVAGR